jgi:hypothetical protein
MNRAVHVLNRVVDNFVGVLASEPFVGKQFICVEGGSRFDALLDFSLKNFLLAVLHNHGLDFAATLDETDHGSFVFPAGSSDATLTLRDVHIASLPTNEGFVHFDFTAHLHDAAVLQSQPETVKHEPSRPLHDAKITPQFITADSVLAVHKKPEANHPLVHAERRIFKDGSDLHGELLLALFAKPYLSSGDEGVAVQPTSWASNLAIRPAKALGILETAVRIGKVGYRFLQGLWSFVSSCVHTQNILELALCVK